MSTPAPEFEVKVTEDSMAAVLTCDAPVGADERADPEKVERLAAAVLDELARLGVRNPPDKDSLRERLREAASRGTRITSLKLVEGRPPVPPRDAGITWTRDFFRKGFYVDPKTGAVDFRRRAADCSLRAGELLARLAKPRHGQPGEDIFGKRIPVAKPRRLSLRAGPGVRYEESDGEILFFAERDGQVRLAGRMLAVDDILEVRGDVNLETGNISHPGSVVIHGDVCVGASVEADGDVEIMGCVEAANVRSGGSITVHGHIAGASGRRIRAAGSVAVGKFVLGADIEAGDNITVAKDVHHSLFRAGGRIEVAGQVLGGKASALGGIVVRVAGCEALTATLLVAGEHPELAAEIETYKRRLDALREKVGTVRQKVAPLLARKSLLTPRQKEAATELRAKVSEMEMEAADLAEEVTHREELLRERCHPVIEVREQMYPEVILSIKGTSQKAWKPVRGPFRAVREAGMIRIVG